MLKAIWDGGGGVMGNVWLVYNRDKTVQGISEVDKEWSSQDERENSATLHKKN